MKRYYSVITSFYDNGRATATMGEVREAERKPDNTWRETARRDIYVDWFDSRKKAIEFAKTV